MTPTPKTLALLAGTLAGTLGGVLFLAIIDNGLNLMEIGRAHV